MILSCIFICIFIFLYVSLTVVLFSLYCNITVLLEILRNYLMKTDMLYVSAWLSLHTVQNIGSQDEKDRYYAIV